MPGNAIGVKKAQKIHSFSCAETTSPVPYTLKHTTAIFH